MSQPRNSDSDNGSDALRMAGAETKVTGSWSGLKGLNTDGHISGVCLTFIGFSVLQGQLPSIISSKNSLLLFLLHFFARHFPFLFPIHYTSLPRSLWPYLNWLLGTFTSSLVRPSQRLWIYHPNKDMVNSDSYCFGWTIISSQSRGC